MAPSEPERGCARAGRNDRSSSDFRVIDYNLNPPDGPQQEVHNGEVNDADRQSITTIAHQSRYGAVPKKPCYREPWLRVGVSHDGLPGGIQITGPWLGDLTTIKETCMIER